MNAPLTSVLAMFAEIDIFESWMPMITQAKKIKAVTNYRGLYSCKQTMPWPIWPRDFIFYATGIFDKPNKTALVVLKSTEDGQTFFGDTAPAVADGHVRMIIKRGFHQF